MIKTFANKETAAVFHGLHVPRFGIDWTLAAQRKLMRLNSAVDVAVLLIPPGNRLKKLSGDREGQWSIRINDQWRICFAWRDSHAWDVEIVDYH